MGMALSTVRPRAKARAVRRHAAAGESVRSVDEDCCVALADPAAVIRLHHLPQVRQHSTMTTLACEAVNVMRADAVLCFVSI